MTLAVFYDFPHLENGLTKFHDFPGTVVTLLRTSLEIPSGGSYQVQGSHSLAYNKFQDFPKTLVSTFYNDSVSQRCLTIKTAVSYCVTVQSIASCKIKSLVGKIAGILHSTFINTWCSTHKKHVGKLEPQVGLPVNYRTFAGPQTLIFQDFPGLNSFSRTLQVLEIKKIQNFRGLSRKHENPVPSQTVPARSNQPHQSKDKQKPSLTEASVCSVAVSTCHSGMTEMLSLH